MSLPSYLYITENNIDDESYFAASRSKVDAVEGSDQEEPILVGTYKLVETNKLKLEKSTSLVEG